MLSPKKFTAVAATLMLCVLIGCKEKKKDEQPPAVKPAAPPAAQPPGQNPTPPTPPPVQAGKDSLDSQAPQVQGLFPKTGQVSPWVKIVPVSFYPQTDLNKIGEPAYFRPYGVDWAADAMYQAGKDADQRLVVQVFHCAESPSAYGLMSAASDQPAAVQFGQEARGGGAELHIWSGNYYVHFYSDKRQGEPFAQAMQQMAREMMANPTLASADGKKPPLAAALPQRDLIPNQVHYFRGPQSLASRGLTMLVHDEALAGVLAMEPDDQLIIAAYKVAGAQTPCFIFIAQFATAEKAARAHRALEQLSDSNTQLGQSLVLAPRIDTVVFGSLTGDEYGLIEDAARRTPGITDQLPVIPTLTRLIAGR